MRKSKKIGMLSISTALSLGILVPSVAAETVVPEQQERIQVRIASVETDVTKKELINEVKSLFPGRFDFLKESDFEMTTGHHYPEDDTIRYDLMFHKEVKGKQVYGNFGFAGEDLQIEYFFYQPADASDALYPAKVSKEEAEKIAVEFLANFSKSGEYQLDTINDFSIENQTLVEPIRYSFSFVRSEKGIPIADQQVVINVLGNGEIVDFYRTYNLEGTKTFDDAAKALSKEEVLKKVKENLSLKLQYQVDYDFRTGKPYVFLAYQPTEAFHGVHALTGQWQTLDGFTAELPRDKGIQMITAEALPAKDTSFTAEKAKAAAEKLLAIDSDKIELKIEGVNERKNYKGQEVYSVQFMYEMESMGHGSELEFDKHTGEMIQYYDVKGDILKELGEEPESEKKISKSEAEAKALQYLKEYAPSYLHDYAMPSNVGYYSDGGIYYLTFPRVVNGITVNGDQIMVSVADDGSLMMLSVDKMNIDNWPALENVITKEEAKEKFIADLGVELRYMDDVLGLESEDDNHYDLVYLPTYNGKTPGLINAYTGDWYKPFQKGSGEKVSHSWAEEELNYLIQIGILDVEDGKSFDGNAAITKGEAIDILVKSLTPIYELYDAELQQQEEGKSFTNIDSSHPRYLLLERAVSMGILDGEGSFDENATITREELAVWYIRALELEKAAQQKIYQLDFADKEKVEQENIGYVALANSYGLLTVNKQGFFYPDDNVTYAQMAASIFRVAKEVYERQPY